MTHLPVSIRKLCPAVTHSPGSLLHLESRVPSGRTLSVNPRHGGTDYPPGRGRGARGNNCRGLPGWSFAFLALVLFPLTAAGAEIVGTVRNATTGQPAADVSVSLLALQRQMSTVADTVTDAQGHYRLEIDANAGERFLVQASFGGANYNAPVALFSADTTTVDITVYESGARLDDLRITEHAIILMPAAETVSVAEFFLVQNDTSPPRAYVPDTEGFRFGLPDEATELGVSVGTQSGMPLRQQAQESLHEGQRTISYEFRPGETQVQVSYQLPLEGEFFELRLPLALPADARFAVIPSAGAEFTSPGLEEVPQTRSPDRRIFRIREAGPDALSLSLRLNPEELARATAPGASASAPQPEPRSNPITLVPQPVNRVQWYVVGLGLFVLGLGLYYLTLMDPAHTANHDTAKEPGRADIR